MISYKRKYLHALVTFVIAAAIAGSGSPVNIFLGFPILANVLYIIALALFLIAAYHLVVGLKISYKFKTANDTEAEWNSKYDKQKRKTANRSFLVSVLVYLMSWFVLTGASSAKLASDSEKEPTLMYLIGLIGVLIAFYLSFRGAKLFYSPIPAADK